MIFLLSLLFALPALASTSYQIDWQEQAVSFTETVDTETLTADIWVVADASTGPQQLAVYLSGDCPSFDITALAYVGAQVTVGGKSITTGLGCPTMGDMEPEYAFAVAWNMPVEVILTLTAMARDTGAFGVLHLCAEDCWSGWQGSLEMVAAPSRAVPEPGTFWTLLTGWISLPWYFIRVQREKRNPRRKAHGFPPN
jgi:hypothetical protein